MTAKLMLGSAQFGMRYGIGNEGGQVSGDEARAILQIARQRGIDAIDTAIAYGTSEEILGGLGVSDWRVVSKLPGIPDACGSVARWVEQAVAGSLSRLRIPALYGLLLHRSQDLLGARGDEVFEACQRLKASGAIYKLGVSIYDPSELEPLLPRFAIDLVQAPFNILDRRLKTSGWMERLRPLGIELHARSVFLQGILLMPPKKRPAPFARWQSVWDVWDLWLEQTGENSLHACLNFVLSEPGIDQVVVGVDSAEHMSEILAEAHGSPFSVPDDLSTEDLDLIHPMRWSTL